MCNWGQYVEKGYLLLFLIGTGQARLTTRHPWAYRHRTASPFRIFVDTRPLNTRGFRAFGAENNGAEQVLRISSHESRRTRSLNTLLLILKDLTDYKIDYIGIFCDPVSGCKLLILLVGERGFEPPTPWSRTRCSTRLSHSPTWVAERIVGALPGAFSP